MTTAELFDSINSTIQQYIAYDRLKRPFRQMPIIVDNRSYFVNTMSSIALVGNTVFVLCGANGVVENEDVLIISDSTNSDQLVPVYFCTRELSFRIVDNRKVEIQDKSEIEELLHKIQQILFSQLESENNSVGNKIKKKIANELAENERLAQFLIALEKEEIVFKLVDNDLSLQLVNGSISQIIEKHIESLKSLFQPHEILIMEPPPVKINFSPELLVMYTALSSASQEYINTICSVPQERYVILYKNIRNRMLKINS